MTERKPRPLQRPDIKARILKISDAFKAERIEQGLTPRQVAEAGDVSSVSVRNVEGYRSSMSIGLFLSMCDGLGISPAELLTAAGEGPGDSPSELLGYTPPTPTHEDDDGVPSEAE